MLGPDIAEFARRLADEADVARVAPERRRLLVTALTGAAVGALVGYVLLPFVRFISPSGSMRVPVQVAVLCYYGLPAIVVVAGAVLAVRIRLRDLPRIRATGRAMMVLLPVAGILVTPLTMAFAWSTGYSTYLPVVITEIAMVMAALGGATVLARQWSLRERRRPSATGAPPDFGVASA